MSGSHRTIEHIMDNILVQPCSLAIKTIFTYAPALTALHIGDIHHAGADETQGFPPSVKVQMLIGDIFPY